MVYLAYTGMQDMFLTETPKFTHFKTVYTRDIPSISRTYEYPFEQQNPGPGDIITCKIDQRGDFITNYSLKVVLPNLSETTTNWVYTSTPPNGYMYGFNSSGEQVCSIYVNSRQPSLSETNWYRTSNITFTATSLQKFNFIPDTSLSYVIFSDIDVAQLFGFLYNPVLLFGGYVRFSVNSTIPFTSQATFQECGWVQIDYGVPTYSYSSNICYLMINTVSLYIGKQLIQQFDSNYIKILKEINTSYKNRPVLSLLEGNDNVVDFDRTYYFDIPFVNIPTYAIPRHDVHIKFELNPLTPNFYFKNITLVVDTSSFTDTRTLPRTYTIPVDQIYVSQNPRCDQIQGPLNRLFTIGDPNYTFSLNGEIHSDSDTSNLASFEHFLNLPVTSNAIVFDGPINMSRIRDKKFDSSNTFIYAETMNVLAIQDNLAGLMFNTADLVGIQKLTIDPIIEIPPPVIEEFVFDYIPLTASNVNSIYSLRRTSFEYKGPVVRVQRSFDSLQEDFYTDSEQTYFRTSSGIDIATWSEGDQDVSVSIWYDQTINNNHIIQPISSVQPRLSLQEGKYCLFFNNSTEFSFIDYYMNTTIPASEQQFTIILKPTHVFSVIELTPSCLFTGTYLNYDRTILSLVTDSLTWYNGTTESDPLTLNAWNVVSGHMPTSFDQVSIVGGDDTSLNIFSYIGYMFELGFYRGETLSSEYTAYYANRPTEFS